MSLKYDWYKETEIEGDGFVCTVQKLSSIGPGPPSPKRSSTGRRTWKCATNRNEAVWTPATETALLQGLEEYFLVTKTTQRDAQTGRFPMRNRYLSDFIHKSTGKWRTHRQISSRLQQIELRCRNYDLMRLLRGDPLGTVVDQQ